MHFVAASGSLSILTAPGSLLIPLVGLLYLTILLNLILAAFNLIPLPPLDGSHIFRHMLPYKALRLYDSIGMLRPVRSVYLGWSVDRVHDQSCAYVFCVESCSRF